MPNRVPLIKPKSLLHLSVLGLIALVAILAALSVGLESVHAQSTAPTISTVAITSSPGTDNAYTTLDVITVGVTFSEAVTATGTPQVTLNIGGKERTAGYSAVGTATGQLLFTYTVQPVDQDDDGVAVAVNSLALNGGTIQATDDSANATLTHSAMTFADHKVDTELVLISNMEQADGTALRINAGESVRLSFDYWDSIIIYSLNQIVLDVKTPSDTLILTVSTQMSSSGGTLSSSFAGSVDAAGRQTFRSNDFSISGYINSVQVTLQQSAPDLYLTATGTGFVELGTTASTAEDAASAYRWSIGDRVYRSTDGTTYTEQTSAHIPRFSVVGHTKETLRILAADIVSEPYNGTAYAAGEHIEARIILNGPVRALATPLTVPLQLGEGAENRRDARLVTIRGNYPFHQFSVDHPEWLSYVLYFAYTVQAGDVDADGVVLGADPLGNALDRNIEYALDNRVKMHLSFPAPTPSGGQRVNASQASACDAVHCAYLTTSGDAGNDPNVTFFGYFGPTRRALDTGNMSGRLFSFGDREYFFRQNAVFHTKPAGSDPGASDLIVWFTQPLQDRAVERLGLELGGRVFAFEEAEAFTFKAPTSEEEGHEHVQEFVWGATGLLWNAGDRVLVKILELPVTATFDAASYTKNEGDTFEVTVTLGDTFETKTVTLPLTATGNGGATDADYSGVPSELVFAPGETEKSFTITVTDDDVDDNDETVTLGFGTLPTTVKTGGDHETATVNITDNDSPEVDFGETAYAVAEGGTVSVQVTLTSALTSAVTIPITATPQGGATSADYSGVPASVTFNAAQTSKSFIFTAATDTVDDGGESVRLSFGTLPVTVQQGTTTESNVTIIDTNDPEVTVSFGEASYMVAEGGTQSVTMTLSADPERTVVIGISTTWRGGATSTDYSGVPSSVTFNSGETSKSFTFMATQDMEDDDGESVRLEFDALPAQVSAGTNGETTISITDDDDPQVSVSFGADTYAVAEGETRSISLSLNADPERTVAIPVIVAANQGGATSADYSGVPASVTFNAGQTSRTLTFTATQDTLDDDDESVRLEFGTLPSRVSEGARDETTVNIRDDDDPRVTVEFGASAYTAPEGGSTTVEVTLSADPERTVVIPLTKTEQGGVFPTDYSGVPSSVTFHAGQTSRTFTFSAAQDDVDDDGESVKLEFGSLPARVSEGTNDETTLNINDDDDPRVTVGFGAYTYEIAEGSTRVFIVALNRDPERTISVPVVIAANQGGATSADYSGVPVSVTFNAGQTSKPFTFNATHDTLDDDGESVKLGFGTLPPRVSLGARDETTVSITDDDDPEVTVAFVQDAYRVVEGRTVTVRITLSADPERTVAIPLSKTEQNGASSADYSGVPASVTFNSGETSKTFDFVAADDTLSDTGESVKLTFGGLPDRVSEGTPAETTVTIRQVSAQFQLDCSQAEWCADLKLDDYTAVDWGWSQLQYNGSFSPPANLSVKSFIFRGVEYTIRAVYVVPGIYPEIDNAYNRVQRGQGEFLMSISHGETWEAAPEGHYQDWELHIGGVVLPFGEAALWGKSWFLWYGLEFQEIFTDWTSSTVNRIGIREIPSVQHLPTVPPAPAYVSAAAQDSDGLRVSWHSPWTRQRNKAITGYIVQWKQASHSWSDSAQVSSREAGPKSISAQVNGLTEGVLYTVRVIATNAVGDGPPSEDAIGRPQSQTPHPVSAAVNGQTLTLRYNRELDMNSVPAESAFMVIAGQGLREVSSVSISGTDVTLTLAQAVTSIDKVQAGYVAPADASGTFLRDTEGNHVHTLGGDLPSVTNETDPALLQPLTARFTNVPASHDGGDSFTFNIEFSEPVWIDAGLGKDNLLRVTGGTVTAAHWLDRRTEKWEVTIQPSSDEDIVVVLPGGRGCSVAGAPCAAGDRVLSGRMTVTISGPTSQQQAANNPATGAPTINGTARTGETLTATTTGISDADGLAGASFTHRWMADDTEISGATGSSYTVTDGDVGKAIRVRVSFTDDAGNAENLTSAATTAVASSALRLEAAAVDGATLTLTYNNDLDQGVTLPASAFMVTVVGNTRSVSGVSVSGRAVTLTLASAVESGEAVTVSYARPDGPNFIRDTQGNRAGSFSGETAANNTAGSTDTSQRADSSEPEAQAPGAPRNLRAATGNSGELAVSWDAPSSDGGSEITGYRVQWKESSGSWDTPANVSETTVTGTTHTITGLTDGTEYSVRVQAVNSEGGGEASPEATAAPVNPTPLTAEFLDTPESHDGSAAFTFELRFSEEFILSYKTLREHAFTVTGGEVDNARRLEPGKNLRWEITFTPDADAGVTIALNATTDCSAEGAICTSDNRMLSGGPELVVPGPPSNSVATGAPTISGTAQVGETLTANTSGISDADGLASASFSYQWLADDADISGGTGNTYSVSDGDVGKTINVRVSFTDDAGNAENLTSAATTAVTSQEPEAQAPGAPRNLRAATGNSGELAVSWDAPSSDGGSEITGYRVQWKESSGSWDTPANVSETTVTGTTHTITGLTDGTEYSVRVQAVNSEGGGEASPEATAAPVNPTPLTAEFLDTPESHDGSAAFTFELRFSEEFILSYKTLREHAFTVTGGEVSNVRRLEAGKNVRWEIKVMPDGDGAITVVLPVTTDCDADGAICAGDGRMLSSRLELTVPGPGQ